MTEKEFEDILCKYPELIEDGLTFKGRQINLYGKIMDILFEDRHKQKLIIELKRGVLKREHIGQIMEYEGGILSEEDPTARVMLVGNRVPPNFQKSLDHHGIEWSELSVSRLKNFLQEKGDVKLLKLFDESDIEVKIPEQAKKEREVVGLEDPNNTTKQPALFIPLEGHWIQQAMSEMKSGKEKIYFYTNANIGQAAKLDIKNVYFKAKGERTVTAVADFIELVTENPKKIRLEGSQDSNGKYYYGYRNLRWLEKPIILTHLKYFKTGTYLRVDVPGPCIIQEPDDNGEVSLENFLATIEDAAVANRLNSLRKRILGLGNNITEYCRKWTWIMYKTERQFCGLDLYANHFVVMVKLEREEIDAGGLDIRPTQSEGEAKIKIHSDTNMEKVFELIKTAYRKSL